jgi:hypothetical protein
MYTYLGIDNVQVSRLSLVCKSYGLNRQICSLWQRKLQGADEITRFFQQLPAQHHPVVLATTWVANDPAGVLARHVESGGALIRYYPWELPGKTLPHPTFRRANDLASQAILEQQYPLTIAGLQKQMTNLHSQLSTLYQDAAKIDGTLSWLLREVGPPPDLDEIPF